MKSNSNLMSWFVAIARNQIEQIIYQRLPEEFLNEFKSLGNPSFIIYDIPLLFEKKLSHLFDLKILVYSPVKLQIERVQKRDNIDTDLAKKIISQQLPIDQKKALSDIVIENDGTKIELKSKALALIKQIFDE